MQLYENLPLHIAIKENCSLDLVKALVEMYPGGLKIEDGTNRVPLGIALEAGKSEDLILYLFHGWTEAKYIECNSKMPSQIATEKGVSTQLVASLERTVVEWLLFPAMLRRFEGDEMSHHLILPLNALY